MKIVFMEELVQIIRKQQIKPVVFGAGETGWKIMGNLDKYHLKVAFFVDNNVEKQGSFLGDAIIKSPQAIEQGMTVVIASVNSDRIAAIQKQLIELKVEQIYVANHCIYNDLLKLRNHFSSRTWTRDEKKYDRWFYYIAKRYKQICLRGLWAVSIGEMTARYFDILDNAEEEGILDVYIPFLYDYETEYCNWTLIKKFGEKKYIVSTLEAVLFWEYVLEKYLDKIEVRRYGSCFNQKAIIHGNKNNKEKYLIKLNNKENAKAEKILEELNIKLGSDLVCIANRDSRYYEKMGFLKISIQRDEIRNAKIASYEKGIKYLLQKNYQVVRMGKESAEQCLTEGVFDYTQVKHNDLLDIYIISKCKFFLSNFSGIFFLPMLQDKPIAICNAFCTSMAGRGCLAGENNIYIPKLYKRQDGSYLNLWDMLLCEKECWDNGIKFQEAGFTAEDNSEEDIYDLIVEMEKRLDGRWDRDEIEDRYLKIVQRWIDTQKALNPYKDSVYAEGTLKKDYLNYNDIFFPAIMGTTFLKKHQFLLEN